MLYVYSEDLQLNAEFRYVPFEKYIQQDHLDLKIMVFCKFHVTLQASAGGFGLDFEISYLDITSQAINCQTFQNLPSKTRLCYSCDL